MSYEIFEKLCEVNGVTPYKVCKATGLTTGTISNWKAGRYIPKADKRKLIADFFGVSLEYLDTGIDNEKESTSGQKYYFDDNTAQTAQEIFENRDLRMLVEAAQGLSSEDLQMAAELLRRMKRTNPELDTE